MYLIIYLLVYLYICMGLQASFYNSQHFNVTDTSMGTHHLIGPLLYIYIYIYIEKCYTFCCTYNIVSRKIWRPHVFTCKYYIICNLKSTLNFIIINSSIRIFGKSYFI